MLWTWVIRLIVVRVLTFSALAWAKDNYYDRLAKMGVTVHTIVGNHTAYYKNTNEVNAVDLLLREYKNVIIYSEPTEVKLGNLPVLFVPWINEENSENTFKSIKDFPWRARWGTLNLTDILLIVDTPWRRVLMANYLRRSPMSTVDTTTLDQQMEE